MTKPKPRRKTSSKAIAAIDQMVTVTTVSAPAPPVPVPGSPATDTEIAFLSLYAEDAFAMAKASGSNLLNPPPDPRLASKWKILSTLTAIDAPLRIGKYKMGAREVFYGWLLQSGTQRMLAIRGTGSRIEWLIDGLFAPRAAHPVAGKVESGFWSVYASMKIDGKPLTSIQGPVTVVGHSLGAALATYASLELAKAGAKVRGVFVASPHPGDAEFCKAFGEAVPDHVMYRNVKDVVPTVPFWFSYSDVPNVKTLSAAEAGIKITGGWGGQHHILSYVALLERNAIASFKPLPIDQPFLDCVHL